MRKIFKVVRVWFEVFDESKSKAHLWARASEIYGTNWKGAYNDARNLYKEIVENGVSKKRSYKDWRVGRFLAWSAWHIGMQTPGRGPGTGNPGVC